MGDVVRDHDVVCSCTFTLPIDNVCIIAMRAAWCMRLDSAISMAVPWPCRTRTAHAASLPALPAAGCALRTSSPLRRMHAMGLQKGTVAAREAPEFGHFKFMKFMKFTKFMKFSEISEV